MSKEFPQNYDQDQPEQPYDYGALFEPARAPDLSELTVSKEEEADPRLKELFEPRRTHDERPRQESESSTAVFYKRVLLGEDVVKDEEKSYEQRSQDQIENEKYVAEPTQGQKLQAFFAIRAVKASDPYVKAIIDKYIAKPEGLPDPSAEADAMRTNAELRYELGSYLLRDKLPRLKREDPHSVPSRVYIGKQKSPRKPGYRHLGRLNSDEYSAMLALTMLDGTFVDPGPGDPIELDEHGKPEIGQHRAAALLLLDRQYEYGGR